MNHPLRKAPLTCAALAMICGAAATASAQCQTDQYQPAKNTFTTLSRSTIFVTTKENGVGQSFVAGVSGDLKSITIWARDTFAHNPASAHRIELYCLTDDAVCPTPAAGAPHGRQLLGVATTTAFAPTAAAGGAYTFYFPPLSPIQIRKGARYAFAVQSRASIFNPLRVFFSTGNPYALGTRYSTTKSWVMGTLKPMGWGAPQANNDLYFETCVEPDPGVSCCQTPARDGAWGRQWVNITPNLGVGGTLRNPSNIAGQGPGDAAMAYDACSGEIVLYSGLVGGVPSSDTWVLDAHRNGWKRWTGPNPPARSRGQIAYDPTRCQILLYGGEDINGNTVPNTWEWRGSDPSLGGWVQVATMGPAVNRHTMAYDRDRRKIVLSTGNGVPALWFFTGTTWIVSDVLGLPVGQPDLSMAWAPFAEGGVGLAGSTHFFGGPWLGSGVMSNKHLVNCLGATGVPPSAIAGPAATLPGLAPATQWATPMIFDECLQTLVIHGGEQVLGGLINPAGTWTWDPIAGQANPTPGWDPKGPFPPLTSPAGGPELSMVYDSYHQEPVVVVNGETWIAKRCRGDANGDWVVNGLDVSYMMNLIGLGQMPGWMNSGNSCECDINGDGFCDFADFDEWFTTYVINGQC